MNKQWSLPAPNPPVCAWHPFVRFCAAAVIWAMLWSGLPGLSWAAASSNEREIRVVQGQFDSSADASAFKAALAGVVDSGLKINNPSDGPRNGDASEFAELGRSVAISGDTAVIGAPFERNTTGALTGLAYVFVRSGNQWNLQATLAANDGVLGDQFGSVAIDGETILVGAPLADFGPSINTGAVYVFTRTGSEWSQQAKLMAGFFQSQAQFGSSVAISGSSALIGAPKQDIPGKTGGFPDAGAAFVFTRTGTSWSEQTQLAGPFLVDGDEFGGAVALSGDTALVGAIGFDFVAPSLNNAGAGFVFARSGSSWSYQAFLNAEDDRHNDDQFGFSVALDGNTAVIGAHLYDGLPAANNAGRAYVFTRGGTVWTRQAILFAADDFAAGDQFGFSVAISGNSIAVGTPFDNLALFNAVGSTYVFIRSGTTWSQQTKLFSSPSFAGDFFGRSVALSGETLIAGANGVDINAQSLAGAAFAFTRAGSGWNQQAQLTRDVADGDAFGIAVAIAGDTALVGASSDDLGLNANAGSAYVFVRNNLAWVLQAKLIASDGAVADQFGRSVALSLNGVAVIGAPSDDDLGNNAGAAYVFSRSGGTWSQQAKLVAVIDGRAGDRFGWSVAAAGETVIIGAPYADANLGLLDSGAAFVFVRSGTSWSQQSRFSASAPVPDDVFGWSVALSSNDIALIGKPFGNPGGVLDAGSVHVYFRNNTLWSEQPQIITTDAMQSDRLGWAVAISNDTAVLGAPSANGGKGAAYAFVRSGSVFNQQARFTAADGEIGDQFGTAVAFSGVTAIVGAPSDDSGSRTDVGSAYSFVRTGSIWRARDKFVSSDPATEDQFGFSVGLFGQSAWIGALGEDSQITTSLDIGAAFEFDFGNFSDGFE